MYNAELENVGELKLLHGAVETLKAYIERQLDSNNGIFPQSKAEDHLNFIKCMQNELFAVAALIKQSETSYCENDLNCTLDDVVVPQSFLDDDINIVFETSALDFGLPYPPTDDHYRERESFSSVYFSANTSLDGTQSDSDETSDSRSMSLDRKLVDAITADDSIVEPLLNEITGKDEVFEKTSEDDRNYEKTPEVISCERDDTDSVTSDVETPPPSPMNANNSIDAITAAIQAIHLNNSLHSQVNDASFNVKNSSNKEILESNKADEPVCFESKQDIPKYEINHSSSDVSNLSRSPLKNIQVSNNTQSVSS